MITHAPTAAPRSVGIVLDEATIALLDNLRSNWGAEEPRSRSEIARELIAFALRFIVDDDPRFADFLHAERYRGGASPVGDGQAR